MFRYFFILLFLCSCATFHKRKEEPKMIQAVELDSSIQEAVNSNGFVLGDWPSYQWWKMFDDQQLNCLMEQALKNNPSLKAAKSRVKASIAKAKATYSSLLFNIDGSLEDDYQHLSKGSLFRFPPSFIPAVVNQVTLALDFEWELDLWGKNRDAYKASLGEANATRADMSQSLLTITILLAETYFNLQANLHKKDVLQIVTDNYEQYSILIEKRYKNGLANQLDVERAQTQVYQQKQLLLETENQICLNQSQIKILLGQSADSDEKIDTPIGRFDSPFPIPKDLPLNLIARRPDLMMQIYKTEAAAYRIGVAKKAFYPNINLSAMAGLQTLSWGTLFSRENFAGTLSPAINLPIFTGGRLTANLEEKEAEFDEQVHYYNELVLKASKQVFDELKTLNSIDNQDLLQKKQVYNFQQIYDLSTHRLENGIVNRLDLILTHINLLQEEYNLITLQNKRNTSLLRLVKALGGGYGNEVNNE